jgi:hypothetical protein
MLVASVLAIVTRLLFRRAAQSSVRSLVLLAITLVPNFMLGRYFTRIGAPKRDASGNLIAAGEDLNQTGLMEYGFDIVSASARAVGFMVLTCVDLRHL